MDGLYCGDSFVEWLQREKDNTYQDIVRPVRVVNVESLGAINKLYTGVVEAEEYSNLAFKLSGPLIAMNVDEGQKVKKDR